MPSLTPDQRRNVMEYALAGEKASSEDKVPPGLLKRMWRAFDSETPVIDDSDGPAYIDIKYPQNGVHCNLTVDYDKPGVRIFDDFSDSTEMYLVVTSPNLSKYQAKISAPDEERLINHVLQTLEAVRHRYPKVEEFLKNLNRERTVVQNMIALKKKFARGVVTEASQREKVKNELSRLLDIPFDEINAEQMNYIQGLLASLGYEPMYAGNKTPYNETPRIIRDAGTADAKQGDIAYIQYLEDSGDLYEEVTTEYVGRIKRLNKPGMTIIVMSDGQEVNLNFVRKILVGENGEGGHYDTAKDEWGPWNFLKDVDIRLPVRITTVAHEVKKTAWQKIKGEKVAVLEAPSVQNGGILTYVNAEGEVDARYEGYIHRIYTLGFNGEIARLSSHLFKVGDRVIVDLDNKTYEGTVVAFTGEPQSQFTAPPMMQVKINNPPDPTHPYLIVRLNSEARKMTQAVRQSIKNSVIRPAFEQLYQILTQTEVSGDSEIFVHNFESVCEQVFGPDGLAEQRDFNLSVLDKVFKDVTGVTFQEMAQQLSKEEEATDYYLSALSANLGKTERQAITQVCVGIQYGFNFLGRETNTTPPVVRMDDLWNTVLQESSRSDLTLGALLRRFSKKPSDFQYRLDLARKIADRKEMFVLLEVLDDLAESRTNIIGLSNSALQIVFEEKTINLESSDDRDVIRFVLGLGEDEPSLGFQANRANSEGALPNNKDREMIRIRAQNALGRDVVDQEFEVIWQAHLAQAEDETGDLGEPDADGAYRHSTLSTATKFRKVRILKESGLFTDAQIRSLGDYGAMGREKKKDGAAAAQARPGEAEKPGTYIISPETDLTTSFADNSKRIIVEVGFGSGQRLLENVRAHPENNYIGIETEHSFVALLNAKLQKFDQPIKNLRLINAKDFDVLPKQQRTIAEIYYIVVKMTDWTLLRQEDGIKALYNALSPDGKIYISSDGRFGPGNVMRLEASGLRDVTGILPFPHLSNNYSDVENERYIFQKPEGDKISNNIDSLPHSETSSPAPDAAGGIDFRSLPIVTQAIGNLRISTDAQAISRLRNADVSRELEGIQRMVDAGISPSGERVKEYVQASSLQGNLDIDKVVNCISDILRHEEETCRQTDPVLMDILVVLESSRNSRESSEVFTNKI